MDATKLVMFSGSGVFAGLLFLALPNYIPPAIAGEEPVRTLLKSANDLWPPAFDPDRLMKWDYYVQPEVSVEPIRESTVRKIGYGRTTMVSVMETESGIYSTDALASQHIEYPGIIKEYKASAPELRYWDGRHWVVALGEPANSFVSITRFKDGALITTEGGNCAIIGSSVFC